MSVITIIYILGIFCCIFIGHQRIGKEVVRVTQPRPVSAFSHKDVQIHHVASSDAAIVVATSKGDVYTLHDYQCRKIAAK